MKTAIGIIFCLWAVSAFLFAGDTAAQPKPVPGGEFMEGKFSETQERQIRESEELKKNLASKSPEEKVKAVDELWKKQNQERRDFVKKQREDALNRIKNSDATEDIKSKLSEECKNHWDRVDANLEKTRNEAKADYYKQFGIKMIPDENKPSVDNAFSGKMVQDSKREESQKKMETQRSEHKEYFETMEKKHKQMESMPKQDIKFDMSK